MSQIVRSGLRTIPFLVLTIAFAVNGVYGQPKELKELKWSHAFDLACRKKDEKDITKDTQRFGVEAFRDNNTAGGIGLFISEAGSIALAPHFQNIQVPVKPSKAPEWLTGLDLPARKAGVTKWDKMTAVHSMEVFKDPNTDNWLYIAETGNIAACDGKLHPGAAGTSPNWIHSVDLQVRKGGVKEWTGAARFGIEVYNDGGTGNLIYITEHGYIAAIPNTKKVTIAKKDEKPKAPEWLHGLDLSCRRHNEKAFTKDTRKFGVEVYNDLHTGNLIFISETGSIAVVPAPTKVVAPTADAKSPVWTHGLNVRARKYREVDFSDDTRAFGAEVFRDENLGVTIYITEEGKIATMAVK